MTDNLLHLHLARFGKGEPVVLFALSVDGERWFEVPIGRRAAGQNRELFALPKVLSNAEDCKNSTAKNSYRRPVVPVSNSVWKLYVDEQEDICIGGSYPDEIVGDFRPKRNRETTPDEPTTSKTDQLLDLLIREREMKANSGEDTSQRLLDYLIKEKSERETREKKTSLREAQLRMLIKKFDRKSNGEQWMIDYEKGCTRANITDDTLRIECLKVCLEDELHDWYDACALKFEPNDWATWRQSFVEAFSSRGWSDIRFAYGFKYMHGSLVTYANKKEKLLLEIDKKMPELHRVYINVHGLPRDVQERLDRRKVDSMIALLSALGEIDDGYQKKSRPSKDSECTAAKPNPVSNKKHVKTNADSECTVCAKFGFPNRVHPIERCWTLNKVDKLKRENKKRHEINLTEQDQAILQQIIAEDDGSDRSDDESEASSTDESTVSKN